MWARAFITVTFLLVLAPVEAADLRDGRSLNPGNSVFPQVNMINADLLVLDPGNSEILRTGRTVRTVIVGNPGIVEFGLVNGDTILLTGKASGSTNLMLLDEDGKVFYRRRIRVGSPPPKPIVVYSGERVQTYVCEPTCSLPPDATPQTTNITNINGVLPGGAPNPTSGNQPAQIPPGRN